jgi:hypothetical protein
MQCEEAGRLKRGLESVGVPPRGSELRVAEWWLPYHPLSGGGMATGNDMEMEGSPSTWR